MCLCGERSTMDNLIDQVSGPFLPAFRERCNKPKPLQWVTRGGPLTVGAYWSGFALRLARQRYLVRYIQWRARGRQLSHSEAHHSEP
uniref:Uncharacterized protein n=1 Tax=Picea glauca TaxID=3330 RepID=A0A124GNC9_PICGL|nr:hypothetical protein ABT39_MTgene4441 [Picea glauca]